MVDPKSPNGAPVDMETLERILKADVGDDARIQTVVPLTASINPVLRIELEGGQSIVLKIRLGEGQNVFDNEAFQLAFLKEKDLLPVPSVLAHRKDGALGPYTYLILSRLPGVPWNRFQSTVVRPERGAAQRELGDLIGRLHRGAMAEQFGSLLPDSRPSFRSWPDCFARFWNDRIEEVIHMDRLELGTIDAVEWIHRSLGGLLRTEDSPRLVHGNLSARKILCEERDGGWRVSGLLDPALSYAHHELDLALLEHQLDVDESFFEGYGRHMALDDGYQLRKQVYCLYHVLDNVRLYGDTHYILSAIDLTREVLKSLRAA